MGLIKTSLDLHQKSSTYNVSLEIFGNFQKVFGNILGYMYIFGNLQ